MLFFFFLLCHVVLMWLSSCLWLVVVSPPARGVHERAVCVLLLHPGCDVRSGWGSRHRRWGAAVRCVLVSFIRLLSLNVIGVDRQVVDLLVAMCRAALESPRKSIIFEPYPSVVDPNDPKTLAFNPKVTVSTCTRMSWCSLNQSVQWIRNTKNLHAKALKASCDHVCNGLFLSFSVQLIDYEIKSYFSPKPKNIKMKHLYSRK